MHSALRFSLARAPQRRLGPFRHARTCEPQMRAPSAQAGAAPLVRTGGVQSRRQHGAGAEALCERSALARLAHVVLHQPPQRALHLELHTHEAARITSSCSLWAGSTCAGACGAPAADASPRRKHGEAPSDMRDLQSTTSTQARVREGRASARSTATFVWSCAASVALALPRPTSASYSSPRSCTPRRTPSACRPHRPQGILEDHASYAA